MDDTWCSVKRVAHLWDALRDVERIVVDAGKTPTSSTDIYTAEPKHGGG